MPPTAAHRSQTPSDPFLTAYMVSLTVCGLLATCAIRGLGTTGIKRLLVDAGVAVKKVARTANEIERKTFHLAGLLVPTIYQLLLQFDYSKQLCCRIVWTITILGTSADYLRLKVPWVNRNWPLRSLLREKEQTQFCGGCYFSLGCTLAIQFFSPAVAMTSIIFLVLGDMSAALIGITFGQDVCVVKLGREGKKSVEGSLAMFSVCFIIGCTIFSQVPLREHAIFIGAFAATLTELYEPLGINDNLTIPVFASVALTWGFERTMSCSPEANPLTWWSTAFGG